MGYVSGSPRGRLPRRQRRYYDCLVRICKMEYEVYGKVMSASAKSWLVGNGLVMFPPMWMPKPPRGGSGMSRP